MKTNLWFLWFLQVELKYVTRIYLSPTVFVWENFIKYNFRWFSFLSRYESILNRVQVHCCILNILWAWKLNHNRIGGMLFQTQTARPCKLRHILTCWTMKLTVSSAWGTLHWLWCAELLCARLQMFCALFSEVFCVKEFCLLYVYHLKEVCKWCWHLLSRVWWSDLQILRVEAKFYLTH
jgi:hypothetical protein